MTSPRICIAGIEVDSKEHLRPVTAANDLITRSLLVEEGGSLKLGAGLELGPTRPIPNRPETEDHYSETRNFEVLGVLGGKEYLDLLDQVEEADLASAFGPGLVRDGNTYAMELGGGDHSLACIRAGDQDRLSIEFGTLYLRASEGARIKVTDARLFEPDQKTVRTEVVRDVNARLADGVEARLMFGLSRPWRKPDDNEERHWLQLNGICLEDDPLSEMP